MERGSTGGPIISASIHNRAPKLFVTCVHIIADSVLVKLLIFFTRKDHIIRLSQGELLLDICCIVHNAYDDEVIKNNNNNIQILLYFPV